MATSVRTTGDKAQETAEPSGQQEQAVRAFDATDAIAAVTRKAVKTAQLGFGRVHDFNLGSKILEALDSGKYNLIEAGGFRKTLDFKKVGEIQLKVTDQADRTRFAKPISRFNIDQLLYDEFGFQQLVTISGKY